MKAKQDISRFSNLHYCIFRGKFKLGLVLVSASLWFFSRVPQQEVSSHWKSLPNHNYGDFSYMWVFSLGVGCLLLKQVIDSHQF